MKHIRYTKYQEIVNGTTKEVLFIGAYKYKVHFAYWMKLVLRIELGKAKAFIACKLDQREVGVIWDKHYD